MYEESTIGFKTTCENCDEYLHSCFNCILYDSNVDRCRSLTTEAIRDRRSSNYCEEFVPNTDSAPGTDSVKVKIPNDFKSLFRKDGE